MNKHVHRLVFDSKRGMRVPAAEHVRSAGKAGGGQTRAVARACAALAAGLALVAAADAEARTLGQVLPRSGPSWNNRTVAPGGRADLPYQSAERRALGQDRGSFTLNYSTDNQNLLIEQTDKNIVINWDTFNIGRTNSVHFQQPLNGAALNKIWDANPTVIMGKLTATGEVILENTNGVIFSPTARIETGRFVATALSLSQETFLAGIRNNAKGEAIFGSDTDLANGFVSVERGAEIRALAGGDVMLIAPKVYNEGLISTPNGQTIMAAGQKVYLMSTLQPYARGLLVAVDAFKQTDPEVPLPEGTNTVEQAEARQFKTDSEGNITLLPDAVPQDTSHLNEMGVRINEVVATTGTINLVGMSIRQNGLLTATTAVKGQNGAIYLQAGASKRDLTTDNVLQNGGYGLTSGELGSVELGANSRTEVKVDGATSYQDMIASYVAAVNAKDAAAAQSWLDKLNSVYGADLKQKDADTFYRSQIQIWGKDVAVRGGAQVVAHGGDINLLAMATTGEGTSDNILLDTSALSAAQDGSHLVVEQGATLDTSGLRSVFLPLTRNQLSGQFFQIELADSPVQRGGVLYRQKVVFDASNPVTVANAKGFYASIERTASELATQGGNIRLESLGDTVVADGVGINIAGGSVRYGSGTLSTSVLRRGTRVVTLDEALPGLRYDELVATGLGSKTTGTYVQGYDAGTAVISGLGKTYAGLSGLKADVVVGPYQRSARLSDGDTTQGRADHAARLAKLAFTRPAILETSPDLFGSLRPLGGTLTVGRQYGASEFIERIAVVTRASASVSTVPTWDSGEAQAFIDALPDTTEILAPHLQQSGVAQLAFFANEFTLSQGSTLNLGASGAFTVAAAHAATIAGSVKAEGGKVDVAVAGVVDAAPGDLTLLDGASLDVSGRVLDERGLSAGLDGLKVDGGTVSLSAGHTLTLAPGSAINVSGGAWRNGLGALSKGTAGTVSLAANAQPAASGLVEVPDAETGASFNALAVDGQLTMQGQLKGFDFNKGGALVLSGLRTLTIGDGAAVNGGMALAPSFFSQGGFGRFDLTALGDVTVLPGTALRPVISNLDLNPTRARATPESMLREVVQDAGTRAGVQLTLQASGQPYSAADVHKLGLDQGGSVTIGTGAVLDVGLGGAISLKAGRNLDMDGSLVAHGGAVSLAILGARGGNADADTSKDGVGYLDDQFMTLREGSVIDVSGAARTVTQADGRTTGEVLAGGTVNLNQQLGSDGLPKAVRGRLIAEAGSLIDLSGATGQLSLGRGQRTSRLSSGAGTLNIGSTDGFLMASTLKAQRPDASVAGGTLNVSVTRNGFNDIGASGAQAYVATERAIVVEADAASVAAHRADFAGQGVLSAQTLANAGFERVQLRADDRVVLGQSVSLGNTPGQVPLRSLVINSPVLQAQDSGTHTLRAQSITLGDADLTLPFGATVALNPEASGGEASLNVEAGLIEVHGHSALRGFGQATLAATLAANGQTDARRDGEVRLIGRHVTDSAALDGALSFAGALTLQAGQVYASTLSSFTIQGLPGASALTVLTPKGGSTSQTPLTALASLSLTAADITIDGVLRQPFGSITINGENRPELGANSLLSVAGDGITVPVGTTVNERTWVYGVDGVNGVDASTGASNFDVNATTTQTLGGQSVNKHVVVTGQGLTISSQSMLDAQAGGDLVATEFQAGVGGSSNTLTRQNVYAILPGYHYDFAPYDTQINASTKQVGTTLVAGDQVEITTSNGVLAAGRYTLLPASYAVLPGAVLVSQTTQSTGSSLKQAVVMDDGSVTVSGYRTAVGTGINGGQDSRLALVLEPESTFRAKSTLVNTSINSLLSTTAGAVRPGDAGRVSLSAQEVFDWAARYQLGAADGFAGGQFDLAMPNMAVVKEGEAAPEGYGAITASSLSATGAASVLLGGVRLSATDYKNEAGKDAASSIDAHVKALSTNVLIGADLGLNEFLAVATDQVRVADQVSLSATGAASDSRNAIELLHAGAALVVSNKVNTDVSRKLLGDSAGGSQNLSLGQGVTLSAAAIQLDSSGSVSKAADLSLRTSALGVGSDRIALGGASDDATALVLDASTLNSVTRLQLRSYTSLDMVGSVALGQLASDGTPLLKELTLDTPLLRGVGTVDDVATVVAEHLTLRNGSGQADASGATGQTRLSIQTMAPVKDATAEALTIADGPQRLAFASATLATDGDLVFRGQDGVLSTQGDVTVQAARLTAASDTRRGGIDSAGVLSILGVSDTGNRSLGDQVGAGATLSLKGQRVLQDGLIDLPSGQLTIEGRGQVGDDGQLLNRNTVEFTDTSVTKAAGWVAQAGSTWATTAPGGDIKVTAQRGDIVLKGTLDVSAPLPLSSSDTGAQAGSVSLVAREAATRDADGQLSALGGAVVLGSQAHILGSASRAATSGVATVDATHILVEAQRGSLSAAASQSLDPLARLLNDGGFHREVDIRVREGNVALNTSMQVARAVLSADAGSLSLGSQAVIDASASRGGVVQLAASGDLVLDGAHIVADATTSGSNGGDVLLASTSGMVKLQTGTVVSALGDTADLEDGRIVIRAQANPTATSDAERVNIAPIQASLKAGEVSVEAVQVTQASTSSSAAVTRALANATSFASKAAAIKTALGLDTSAHVRAGVEIQSTGDFTVDRDWQLATTRPGSEPLFLTVRAQGNININNNLSDGFASASRALATATTPSVINTGAAASYRLVAGADLSAAHVLKVDESTSADLRVAAGKMVRTTSGSIEMAASHDVVLAKGTGATPIQAVVYVAGKPSAKPADAAARTQSAWLQFTNHGGRLDVTAGHDVMAEAGPTQLFGNWLLHEESFTSDAGKRAWATAFDAFKQGLGSMGGGNVRVTAGNNVSNLGVVAPSSARSVKDAATGVINQVQDNGGDVLVRAGQDVRGGVFLIGRGEGRIEAGGAITTGDAFDDNKVAAYAPILGTLAGTWSLKAQDGVAIAADYNPTSLSAVIGSRIAATPASAGFFTYSADAALSVTSVGGDVVWQGGALTSASTPSDFIKLHTAFSPASETLAFKVNQTAVAAATITSLSQVAPPKMEIKALTGDVRFNDLTEGLVLFPSAQGDLSVFAGKDIQIQGGTAIVLADADTSRWHAVGPSGTGTGRAGIDATGLDTHSGTLHQDDAVPVRIHADGDILGGTTLNIAKPADISAGGDISELTYVGQNFHDTDVTRIAAGGALTGASNLGTITRQLGLIQLGGPGELQIEAGTDIDLATSAGIETVGRLVNPALPADSAHIRLAAGTSKQVDVTTWAQSYVAGDATAQADLVAYVERTLKLSGLSYEQALVRFSTLTPAHQASFAEATVQQAFVRSYVTPTSVAGTDSVWAFIARQAGVPVADTSSALFQQYDSAQKALISYVQTMQSVSGLGYADALSRYRSMGASDQAGLVDKKKAISPVMVAAFIAAVPDAPYQQAWLDTVEAAKAANPGRASDFSATDFNSALFKQFKDKVLMSELKRIGAAASSIADSDNAVANERRQAVRQVFWQLADQASEVAGLGAGFTAQGDINLAGSMVRTRGTGDATRSGIDLIAPGGQVLVGFASSTAIDKAQAADGTRGLVTNGGSIRSFSRGDFQVNSQKAFVVGQGDLLVYSAQGNIDSGRGSNTDVSAPEPEITRDPVTGIVTRFTPPPTTGSGIGIVKDASGLSVGTVSLLAPRGEVRALDAFIQGPELVVPGKVLGGDNLKGEVKGQAAVAPVSVALSVNSGLGTETAAGEAKDEAIKAREKAKEPSSLVTVDVLGLGDGEATAADATAKDAGKDKEDKKKALAQP